MAIRRLFVGVACVMVAQCLSVTGHTQGLTNWIRPYNFYTPSLNAGQYAFQAGVALDGQKSTSDIVGFEGPYTNETTSDRYSFSSSLLYAFTNRWAVASNVNFTPGQTEQKSTSTGNPSFVTEGSQYNLKPTCSLGLTLTYKPTPALELFGTASYNRTKRELEPEGPTSVYTNASESYHLFFGFNTGR